jgi:hypothetical protein
MRLEGGARGMCFQDVPPRCAPGINTADIDRTRAQAQPEHEHGRGYELLPQEREKKGVQVSSQGRGKEKDHKIQIPKCHNFSNHIVNHIAYSSTRDC